MATQTPEPTLHGLMAEFDNPTALVAAAEKARLAGYRQMDAYSPIPIEELTRRSACSARACRCSCCSAASSAASAASGCRYWASASRYPMNVGGRPFHSWPQFIPVTFETTVLGAALTAFFGMWALNRLPQPYHPVFNVPAFARASTDRFFLCIEAADPRFDRTGTWQFLEGLHPVGVSEVAP